MREKNKSSVKAKSKRLALCIALLVICSCAGGCSSIAYYSQSVIGHSQLMLARTPIDKAIAQAQQQGRIELVDQLRLAKKLRVFASDVLGLPDNQSYQSVVDLQRDYPVWNVVAATEFSVEAKQWCYLIIGCANYRGYFSLESAERYANQLRAAGYEAVVGGVGAYSTLGWFADPLLPSMYRHGEAALAETMFHELAHQVAYVNGESDFNEAFATVVGEYGAQQWLAKNSSALSGNYLQRLTAQREFNQLLLRFKQRLATTYNSGARATDMRTRKSEMFEQLREEYELLKQVQWNGRGWYDYWMASDVNNARLASVATYYELVPGFEALLARCKYDLRRFYEVVESLTQSKRRDLEDVDCTVF